MKRASTLGAPFCRLSRCCGVARRYVYYVEDQTRLVSHVHSPILVLPNLTGVTFQKFAGKLRHLNSKLVKIVGFNVCRVPDLLLGS